MTYPPNLKKNDKVIILAPAGKADKAAFENGVSTLKSWGLNPVIGKYAQGEHKFFYAFSGTDEERLSDFQTAIDDPEIRAIICVRGGYGTNRIIDKIDFTPLITNPKWIVGFSDITVLHCHLNRLKIPSIHGITPSLFTLPTNQIAMKSLQKALFGEQNSIEIASHPFNKEGKVNAEVLGGNIAILVSLIGTNSDFDTTDKILFLEEVGETPYRLDRMLVQLERAGKFEKLAGLIVGDLEGSQNEESEHPKNLLNTIILEKVKNKNYPICFDFPVGHQAANFAMICGVKAELSIQKERSQLIFPTQKTDIIS